MLLLLLLLILLGMKWAKLSKEEPKGEPFPLPLDDWLTANTGAVLSPKLNRRSENPRFRVG